MLVRVLIKEEPGAIVFFLHILREAFGNRKSQAWDEDDLRDLIASGKLAQLEDFRGLQLSGAFDVWRQIG